MFIIKRMLNRVKKDDGFTLVELLAVIAIIGVLIAIAVPNIMGMIDRAETGTISSDASTVKNAVETYVVTENYRHDWELGHDAHDHDYGSDDTDIVTWLTDDGILYDLVDIDEDRANNLHEAMQTAYNVEDGLDAYSDYGDFHNNDDTWENVINVLNAVAEGDFDLDELDE